MVLALEEELCVRQSAISKAVLYIAAIGAAYRTVWTAASMGKAGCH